MGIGAMIFGGCYLKSQSKKRKATIEREIEAQNRKYCDRGVTWRHYTETKGSGRNTVHLDNIQIAIDVQCIYIKKPLLPFTVGETTPMLKVYK